MEPFLPIVDGGCSWVGLGGEDGWGERAGVVGAVCATAWRKETERVRRPPRRGDFVGAADTRLGCMRL